MDAEGLHPSPVFSRGSRLERVFSDFRLKTMRTFCLSLPETPERREAAKHHFLERGVEAEFIDGIHAENFGLLTWRTYDVDHPGTGFRIPAKHVGLCLSHYVAWSICAHLPDEWFMILEDDADFAPDWKPRLEQAVREAPPDTDILLIGSCNCMDKPRIQIAGSETLWRVQWPQCTQAMVIHRKAIPTLIQTQRKIYAPIDLALIFHSYPHLNVYTVLPRIVGQRGQEINP
jgi:GR25 family glycosyltransferase involved in LPS biosynthesis